MRYSIGLIFAIGCSSASGIEGDGSLESSSEAGETDTTARGEDDAEVGESGGGSSEESGDAAVPVHRIADLVGQPCREMGELRICALNQSRAQVCGWWDDELRWTACERSIECVPGEILDCDNGSTTYCVVEADGVPHPDVCGFTPLAIDFDGGALALQRSSAASFDIAANGACLDVDWPSRDMAWLVMDRDGDGAIADGSELFGSGTPMPDRKMPRNGFAALAVLDDDRDGSITYADPRFAALALWFDRDEDRRGTADELVPLAAMGIARLPLGHRIDRECDDRGNCILERTSIGTRVGARELVDIHLACQ